MDVEEDKAMEMEEEQDMGAAAAAAAFPALSAQQLDGAWVWRVARRGMHGGRACGGGGGDVGVDLRLHFRVRRKRQGVHQSAHSSSQVRAEDACGSYMFACGCGV